MSQNTETVSVTLELTPDEAADVSWALSMAARKLARKSREGRDTERRMAARESRDDLLDINEIVLAAEREAGVR